MSADLRQFDLVPLGDRLRASTRVRIGLIMAIVAVVAWAPAGRHTSVAAALGPLVAHATMTAAAWFGRATVLRRRRLFGAAMVADAAMITWAAYATGLLASPLLFLVPVHLVTVALLASYRTGLRVAIWHAIFLTITLEAMLAGVFEPVLPEVAARSLSPRVQMGLWVAGAWLVTLVTSNFSALNERELRRSRFDLDALARLAARLEREVDAANVAQDVTEALVETFDLGAAALIDVRGGGATLLAASGHVRPVALVAMPPRSGARQALLDRAPVLRARLDRHDEDWICDLLPDATNVVALPMVVDDVPVGVLLLVVGGRAGASLPERTVRAMERFAAHGSLALANAWLQEELEVRASMDGLTGIANRRTFDLTLERELSRASRSGETVSLLLFDLDHFKRLNDTYGHQEGDRVLRETAQALQRSVRTYDTVARYGGEEFGVILPRTAEGDAVALAQRLRSAISGIPGDVRVTASVGAASMSPQGSSTSAETSASSLIEAADTALYEAKDAGRDRVVAARLRA